MSVGFFFNVKFANFQRDCSSQYLIKVNLAPFLSLLLQGASVFHNHIFLFCYCPPPPRLSRKQGTLKLIRPSIRLSVRQSVRLSVSKTLTWLISSEVLMKEHWYFAYMILVTSPFYWYHAMTLTFYLLQGQICCRAGDEILRVCLFL